MRIGARCTPSTPAQIANYRKMMASDGIAYTQEQLDGFKDDAETRVGRVVLMNPWMVEISVNKARAEGMEHGRDQTIQSFEIAKHERRKWLAVNAAFGFVMACAVLWTVSAIFTTSGPTPF